MLPKASSSTQLHCLRVRPPDNQVLLSLETSRLHQDCLLSLRHHSYTVHSAHHPHHEEPSCPILRTFIVGRKITPGPGRKPQLGYAQKQRLLAAQIDEHSRKDARYTQGHMIYPLLRSGGTVTTGSTGHMRHKAEPRLHTRNTYFTLSSCSPNSSSLKPKWSMKAEVMRCIWKSMKAYESHGGQGWKGAALPDSSPCTGPGPPAAVQPPRGS